MARAISRHSGPYQRSRLSGERLDMHFYLADAGMSVQRSVLTDGLSELGYADPTDHQSARKRKQQYQWVQSKTRDRDVPKPECVA